jgi:topoisomerase-4 subunit B
MTTADLFRRPSPKKKTYTARDIEVLEGLEPVRRRPGMYIGGTDEAALHHLVSEVLDNAMDEAVAGFADRIEVELMADGTITIGDNGRGIPVDPHPKFRDKSALEVILTTLHSGGKFDSGAYGAAGGLHGVGLSVVNALADSLRVEVARDRKLWSQEYQRGKPKTKLNPAPLPRNRRGTTIRFHPDPEIFGPDLAFRPLRVYRLARSKACLYRGVEIGWNCDPALLREKDGVPASDVLHFPGGLADYLTLLLNGKATVTPRPFAGQAESGEGRVEWAIAWPADAEGFLNSYCNTVPTPDGGSHESGLRGALARGLKAYGEMKGNRRAARIAADDVTGCAAAMLSVFVRNPQFQGQTKERLALPQAAKWIEAMLKDHFEHWLSGDPESADALLAHVIERTEERLRRRQDKEFARRSATRKLRLPGKLADCTREMREGTEIFLVEGDSAGGSAKQARNRATQAILPLRGKILNVASATPERLRANKELADLTLALGCGANERHDVTKLRYERVVVMTDADVDGAHIASLLMTFFFREMADLVTNGHLYLALPPLYRIVQGSRTVYARDDAHKEELLNRAFNRRKGKIEISRFKGLGEMSPAQLKETTMDPKTRTLLRVTLANGKGTGEEAAAAKKTARFVEDLMGRRPEPRFAFIRDNAGRARDLDI